ncbi:hypothetical protein [uncultured Propionibacterium sp.]|uniref:hypothetical protein n=1 Tax=uncultured Propionibacterium sp. TaxID=218066 RepID=UPI0029302C92|nr:hypothetical protein [uncultured Propionibacterium sp.]
MTVRSRRPLIALVVVAAVLVLVLAALIVRSVARVTPEEAAEDESSSSGISVSAVPSETVSPVRTAPVTPLSGEAAADATLDALTRTATALSDPGNPADLSDVLTDGELSSYQAQADEFLATGVHQSGAPTIENARITSVSEDGTGMSIEACVDSSSVQVLNDQGADLHASQPKRSLTIFTLTNPDGSWKLASESFPDDPTC